MKVHATQEGRKLLRKVFAVSLIFLAIIGYFVFHKIKEWYLVNEIPDCKQSFSPSTISYNCVKSLRKEFRKHRKDVRMRIERIKKLQKEYPLNNELKQKLKKHESYLHSMRKARFNCPEHQLQCADCRGKGRKLYGWGQICKNCNGKGVAEMNTTKGKVCPNCLSDNKIITGGFLLK